MQLAVLELSMRRFLRACQGQQNELDGWSKTVLCPSWILPNLVDVSTNPPPPLPPTPRVTFVGTRYAISAEDAKANNNKAKHKKHNKHNKDNKDNTKDAL